MSKITYTADNIQYLEGIEHVRLRPSMYIGDIGTKGLHHLVYEVVDNSIDEALAGFCKKISVIIKNDNSILVLDDGRGIPIDFHKKEKKSALEVVMTKIGAGGKFDKGSYKISGGLHGVGLSCVNALSSRLIATIYRDGKIYQQEYKKGQAISNVKILGITNKNGTEILFTPDKSIFKDINFNYDILSYRLRELSFLNKGLLIFLTDEREIDIKGNFVRKNIFHSEIGLKEFLLFIDKNKEPINDKIIYIEKIRENVPIEIAMRYNNSFNENIYSYVNNIKTNEGGTHLSGFRRALTRTLKKYTEESGYFDKYKIEINGDDFREGLTAIISIKVMEPQFEGQTKTKLGNNEVGGIIDKVVSDTLNIFLEENPSDAKKIIEKIIISAKARQAAKKARELIQRKNIIVNSTLPGKLADCSLNDPSICEIYLVEGDSAGGTAKQGRDRNFQAILPLRGKILNVEKAAQYKILDNEEIKNIFTALGVFIGTDQDSKELNINKLRYHKIVIMTDADVDGSHISTLILTFIFRYMKLLIEKGYVYIATPPLFCIKKGNIENYYAWNEKEREEIINKIGKDKKIHIQRYKGLGEMNSDQLWETTMNPKNRTLRRVTIQNSIESDQLFSMLMGENVIPRKKFIEENALYARIDV